MIICANPSRDNISSIHASCYLGVHEECLICICSSSNPFSRNIVCCGAECLCACKLFLVVANTFCRHGLSHCPNKYFGGLRFTHKFHTLSFGIFFRLLPRASFAFLFSSRCLFILLLYSLLRHVHRALKKWFFLLVLLTAYAFLVGSLLVFITLSVRISKVSWKSLLNSWVRNRSQTSFLASLFKNRLDSRNRSGWLKTTKHLISRTVQSSADSEWGEPSQRIELHCAWSTRWNFSRFTHDPQLYSRRVIIALRETLSKEWGEIFKS